MTETAFPVPDDQPEAAAFADGLTHLSREWPFEDIEIPTLGAFEVSAKRSDSSARGATKSLLKGYWTHYPTYCLIAYPTTHEQHASKLDCLKHALTAAHLLLLQSMENSAKHYQSRLEASFRAYRQLYEKRYDETLALLPFKATTLTAYEEEVAALVEEHYEDQTLHDIHRALEGAIAGSGGHTRNVNSDDADKIVGQNVHKISSEGISGQLIQNRKKINNERTTTANRLARDESATGPVLYQPAKPISPEFGESVHRAIYAAKGQKASLMRLNQLLIFDWSRLSLSDIHSWFSNLGAACEVVSTQHNMACDELQALCSLMFWTGRSVQAIHDVLMVNDSSGLPRGAISQGYIVHEAALAVFPKIRPDGAKEVSSKWQAYVRASADRIIIPLPSAAREQVKSWLDARAPSGSKGKRLFTHEPADLTAAVEALITFIRKKHGPRLTTTRLVRQLPITLSNQCGDAVRAAAALAVSASNRTTTGLYYYSATQQELASVYWRTSGPLSDYLVQSSEPEPLPQLPASTETRYVGTNVCPDDGEKIRQKQGFYSYHTQDLRNALAYCRSRMHKPGFTVVFHNAYVSYCIAMLGAVTGYRAVKNPLTDIRALDEPTGLLVISDKDFDDYRNARLTWVPPVLHAQLRAYSRYRDALVRCLQLENEDPPFFFFLNDNRRAKPVAPHSLASALRWSSELPLNANRHYLRTRLTEKRVPGEIIDAFMGHWDIGEEPYGPYSALSPAEFKAAIAPALTDILAEQGWREEHVVTLATASDISPDVRLDANPACRERMRRKDEPARARRHDLERLQELFRNAECRLVAGDTAGKPPIDQVLSEMFQKVREHPEIHDWRFVHNRLVRRLADGKKAYGWPIEVPSPVVMFNQAPAPFTPQLFRDLAELRPIERAYNNSLRALDPSKPNIDDITSAYAAPFRNRRSRWTPDLSAFLVGQILFAAARYGGLLSRNALTELLHNLASGGMVIRDHLVFDLTAGALTRRWYADPLSCTLILRYRWLAERDILPIFSRSADDAVRAIVRGLQGEPSRLERLPAFLGSAAVAWQLTRPAYLYRWARNASGSCSWSQETEIRVRFDRRVRSPEDKRSPASDTPDVEFRASDLKKTITSERGGRRCDLNRAYRAFYECLTAAKQNSSWRGQVTRQIKTWLEACHAEIGPVPTLFVQWTQAIVLRQTPAHQGIGAASSLRTYVSRIGRTLFTESKGIGINHLNDIDIWKGLYQSVVDSKHGPRARSLAAAECQTFHNYAVRRIDAPTFTVGEAVGTGPTIVGAVVNANYVTPFEVERAVALLSQGAGRDRNYEIAGYALELGYWSGLRLGELLGLRLRDIDIAWTSRARFKRVEVLCRAHSSRALKSRTSLRRVPISCLMPKPALNRFVRFVMQREHGSDEMPRKGAAFLFSNSELGHILPDERDIRGLVQLALRQVTGDNTLVFHHLRHSAANNALMALMARSDDDPIWGLFPRTPEALLDVSRRINRGLMINTNRRRSILHAVETLLGHTEPNVTLQSYIHILPWICAAQPYTCGVEGHYTGLERDVALDSSLLAKSKNATRSWRSRNDSTSELQPIADHWLRKFRTHLPPPGYARSETPLPTTSQALAVPPRPLPSFHTIYLVALFIYQIEMNSEAPCSSAELSRIAVRSAVPFWLISHLRQEMIHAFAKPATRADVRTDRQGHHNRYASVRAKYFRGHGHTVMSALDQRPELHGLIPALPRTKADLAACRKVWGGLSNLLEETGRWEALTEDIETQLNQEADDLLSKGLEIFMARTNSSDHTLKFFRAGLDAARSYIAFAKRVCPHNRILVELKPPITLSESKALAMARKDLELKDCVIRAIKPTRIGTENWPYGIPSVRLLAARADISKPKTLVNSYGAWFAQYSFALLYRAICHKQRFARIPHAARLAAEAE